MGISWYPMRFIWFVWWTGFRPTIDSECFPVAWWKCLFTMGRTSTNGGCSIANVAADLGPLPSSHAYPMIQGGYHSYLIPIYLEPPGSRAIEIVWTWTYRSLVPRRFQGGKNQFENWSFGKRAYHDTCTTHWKKWLSWLSTALKL